MLYRSTRGQVQGLSFEDALFHGYAADGGLLVPHSIPRLSPDTLQEWRELQLTYPEVVVRVVRLFVAESELSTAELEHCVQAAYSKFAAGVLKVRPVVDSSGKDVQLVELFHGPTGSFKDLSMSLIGQLMDRFLARKNKHVILLVGTTGDTGSAAMNAVRASKHIDILGLYPKGRVSRIQEEHMRSMSDSNIHLYEVEGTSDDLDIPIKDCFPGQGLASVNAINWARVMIQIAHHTWLYVQSGEPEIGVVIPTGAAGNLTAAVFAERMGVPLKVSFATNENDCLHVLLSAGELEMDKEVLASAANAMDVCHPYNVERILWLFSDPDTVLSIMDKGRVSIPPEVLARMKRVIRGSMRVEDTVIFSTITDCSTRNDYLICPHTATALAYSAQLTVEPRPLFVYSTAAHFKFPETADKVGIPQSRWNANSPFAFLDTCWKRVPKAMRKTDDWFAILQTDIQAIQAKHLRQQQGSEHA